MISFMIKSVFAFVLWCFLTLGSFIFFNNFTTALSWNRTSDEYLFVGGMILAPIASSIAIIFAWRFAGRARINFLDVGRARINFLDAVKTCFKKYTKLAGRASRAEYWYWFLFILIAGGFASVIDSYVIEVTWKYQPVSSLFSLATALPGIAVSVRRLHDINRSGWWLLAVFTVIGLLLLIYWALRKGDAVENRFGNPTV